ncbi:putative hydroxypyruvate isomerase isoform X2 [Chelonus insularis]|uniref:putative hydroxypyruvate isomerase isoform X2 n=1 Tax=Chelonus insularis TaxID=460826 RepID=UPI00158E8ECD|nr:putative hydroxypyruvate isomerase isoform X2 [Chelonus insularis]
MDINIYITKDAGFHTVESGFPFGYTIQQVQKAKEDAGIQQVLINVFTGDVTKGELGYAAIPGKEIEFRNSIEMTIDYAKALDCNKIHIMAGIVDNSTSANDAAYESNLRYAVEKFKTENILGLIEPINSYSVPNYYLNCYEKAIDIIRKINSPHLKLMLDIFHLQHIRGNISNFLKHYGSYIGHVQIAQVPDRNEPDTPGELNYQYILPLISKCGYNDYIGLEYKPKTSTISGLKWMKNFDYYPH